MIILLDLDGTLTDTAHAKFKPYKDGIEETDLSLIPIIPGAIEFVEEIAKGHIPVIVSDSHPRYVNKIAKEIFNLEVDDLNERKEFTQVIYLADKPNINKTFDHLCAIAHELDPYLPMIHLAEDKDQFIMIGDSWLDIELGRRLNIRTVLTQFYRATSIEERDGIGQDWKPIKAGPTYYARTFAELTQIIENPIKSLLALEAIFQNENSDTMVKFLYRKSDRGFIAFRCLARQEDGECDRFARADKYRQIDDPHRSEEFLGQLAKSVSNYLARVAKYPEYHWDYLTYVSDKRTTNPPNKMKQIFDLIESKYPKESLFYWTDDVTGKLREQPNYKARREYIAKYLKTIEGTNLNDKNIIVIDDQFTSSATANEISQQLRNKGAKNILFVSLFYLILPVEIKTCPNIVNGNVCAKTLKIKINSKNGNKFYSCPTPQYRGNGCGYIENISI